MQWKSWKLKRQRKKIMKIENEEDPLQKYKEDKNIPYEIDDVGSMIAFLETLPKRMFFFCSLGKDIVFETVNRNGIPFLSLGHKKRK